MKNVWVLLLAGSAVCVGQSVTRTTNPNASAILRVCLAPVKAQLVRVGVKGGESLSKEAEEWSAKLGDTLLAAITDAGGQVSRDLSAEPSAGGEARESIMRIRQRYDTIWPQIRKKRDGVKKGRYTIGDEILLLPCARDADSVAFINAEGLFQTGGRKTLSILTGGLAGAVVAMSRYRVWISFLDASTGEVKTLLTINGLGGKMGKDPEAALRTRLAGEFRRMHVGGAPAPDKAARM